MVMPKRSKLLPRSNCLKQASVIWSSARLTELIAQFLITQLGRLDPPTAGGGSACLSNN
jgi:hypothetical protein